MKISIYDRYQALMRSELYREDYQIYIGQRGEEKDWAIGGHSTNFHAKLSEPGKWLCKKWNLHYPLIPHHPYNEKFKNLEDFLFSVMDAPISYLVPPEQWRDMQAMGWDDTKGEDVFTHVNGKLVLMIDPSYSYGDIKRAFEMFIKRWIKPSSERNKEGEVNIWEVFDAHELQAKKWSQITRDIFKFEKEKNMFDNPQFNACYGQVKRAYNKAQKIIRYIEQSADSPSKD